MVISKTKIETIHSAKELLVNCSDQYNTGMYNGMEYALSVIEGRKPEYFMPVCEMEKENEEVKRTIKSGIRRK